MNYYFSGPREDELYHYGVKGMKWGVRHDKESSGRSKWSTKKKVMTGAAIAGGALAVLGGVYLYKTFNTSLIGYSTHYSDILGTVLDKFPDDNAVNLKKGTVLQRISSEAVEDYTSRGQEYVSHLFKDNAKYKTRLSSESWLSSGSYVHKVKAVNGINAPSSREAAKVFSELNPKAKHFEYKNFMISGIRDESNSTRNRFVNELKRRGYNAVVDENDRSWTNSPLIVFDPSKNMSLKKSKKLGSVEKVIATIMM